MKNRWLFAAMAIGSAMLSSVSLGYFGGNGSAANPYQIASKADLLALAADTGNYNKCFILKADVNLTGEHFNTAVIAPDIDPVNNDFQGTSFSGVFDGNGHTISKLTT
jgi:hypothetical protein